MLVGKSEDRELNVSSDARLFCQHVSLSQGNRVLRTEKKCGRIGVMCSEELVSCGTTEPGNGNKLEW